MDSEPDSGPPPPNYVCPYCHGDGFPDHASMRQHAEACSDNPNPGEFK